MREYNIGRRNSRMNGARKFISSLNPDHLVSLLPTSSLPLRISLSILTETSTCWLLSLRTTFFISGNQARMWWEEMKMKRFQRENWSDRFVYHLSYVTLEIQIPLKILKRKAGKARQLGPLTWREIAPRQEEKHPTTLRKPSNRDHLCAVTCNLSNVVRRNQVSKGGRRRKADSETPFCWPVWPELESNVHVESVHSCSLSFSLSRLGRPKKATWI